jgi:nucleoside-specific outer membrane channel protein Tsx
MRCPRLFFASLAIISSTLIAQPTNSPVTKTASPESSASSSSAGKSATGWSSLPPEAQRTVRAALETDNTWIQQQELLAPDGAAGDQFGASLAVSGSTLVIGAPQHAVGSNASQGAAYVFVQNGEGTWSLQAELYASDGAADDQFGSSVAVTGSTLVVGAFNHTVGSNGGQGAVYVFVQSGSTWSQQAELTASNGAAGDQFGACVAISGSTIAVGAPDHPVASNSDQGTAYVFAQGGATWSQQAELTASDGAAGDHFGSSVAVDATVGTAVAGAPGHTIGSNTEQGTAYVFGQSGDSWSQQAELTSADGALEDSFGASVAVSGNTVVAGAPSHTLDNGQQGAAYVFGQTGATWTQQGELVASDGGVFYGGHFGSSVALNATTVLVGAPRNWVYAAPGTGYVFAQNGTGWAQQQEWIAPDYTYADLFGASITMSGATAAVGAPYHWVDASSHQGAAYVLGSSGPIYTLAANPGSLSLMQGTQATTTVTITSFNGFSGSVSLSAPELPTGVTAGFSPNPAIGSSTLTLTASDTATLGSWPPGGQVLVGTSGSLTQTTLLPLTVTGMVTVTVTPSSLTFSDTAVNTTSTSKAVTLTNTSDYTLDIGGISLAVGTNFSISSNTCGATLYGRAKCKVSVTFTPTQLGTVTDTLIFTDAAIASPQEVSLSGTGEAQATLTPSPYTFANAKVGDSKTHTFTLKNNLPTTLTGISYSLTGSNVFSIESSTCTTTLDSKKSCTVDVTFTPSSEETFTGTLTVTDSANDSPQTSSLTGTGN